MKISRLVLGTNNPGKAAEWSVILNPNIPVVSISEIGKFPEPEETGANFAQNARLKARHYAKLIGEYVMADDGGYEIDALGGWPGVKSRRILPGEKEGADKDLIDYVLERMRGVPTEKRGVKLTTAVVVADPTGKIIFEDQESSVGLVTETPGPVVIPGYPFRSIHWLPEFRKTYAELTAGEYDQHSHKRRVAQGLMKFLIKYRYA